MARLFGSISQSQSDYSIMLQQGFRRCVKTLHANFYKPERIVRRTLSRAFAGGPIDHDELIQADHEPNLPEDYKYKILAISANELRIDVERELYEKYNANILNSNAGSIASSLDTKTNAGLPLARLVLVDVYLDSSYEKTNNKLAWRLWKQVPSLASAVYEQITLDVADREKLRNQLDRLGAISGNKLFVFLASNSSALSPQRRKEILLEIRLNMTVGDRLLLAMDGPNELTEAESMAGSIRSITLDPPFITASLQLEDETLESVGGHDSQVTDYGGIVGAGSQAITITNGNGEPKLVLEKGKKVTIRSCPRFTSHDMKLLAEECMFLPGRSWTAHGDKHVIAEYLPDLLKPLHSLTRWVFDKAVGPDKIYEAPIALRNPFIFYEGHLACFYDLKCLDLPHSSQRALLFERGRDPDIDDPTIVHSHSAVPKDPRKGYPSQAETTAYSEDVFQRMQAQVRQQGYSEAAVLNLEHEAMHLETLCYMLSEMQLRIEPAKRWQNPLLKGSSGANLNLLRDTATSRLVTVQQSTVSRGAIADSSSIFLWDNESPPTITEVAAFAVTTLNVTNAEYLEFVRDGGYDNPKWWDAADFKWLQANKVRQPHMWLHEGGPVIPRAGIKVRTLFDGPVDWSEAATWPVQAMRIEAEAYLAWRQDGSRLIREEEYLALLPPSDFQRASKFGNNAYKLWRYCAAGSMDDATALGVCDLVGNGWEWTSTVFDTYAGFKPNPLYPNYSADFFDGKHFVMRGASPFTDSMFSRRPTFRNWFQDKYPYVPATFRVAKDLGYKS